MNKNDVKMICKAHALKTGGSKAVLLERLREEMYLLLEKKTVNELKDICRAAGLLVGGRKKELIERVAIRYQHSYVDLVEIEKKNKEKVRNQKKKPPPCIKIGKCALLVVIVV